ncbi:MAG: hypothetical protein HOW73_32145 [Polyangiaceae bacterium]|nr:hypothetical protein [Polyangiaceae bacterium]
MLEATEEENALAASLTSKALEGFDAFLTPDELELVRAVMEADLVATPEGRRLLRACRPDPTVNQSGDLAVKPEASPGPRAVGKKK